MQTTWTWPARRIELEVAGTVPSSLDGLFVLPEPAASSGQEPLLHAVRMCQGQAPWYSTCSRAELELVDGFHALDEAASPRPITTQAGQHQLAWKIDARHGRTADAGSIAMESPSTLLDAVLTSRHVVLLAWTEESLAGSARMDLTYQLGVAARTTRSRVHWYLAGDEGWPTLLHASEVENRVLVELAHGSAPDLRGLTLSRVALGLVDRGADVHALSALQVDWPIAHPRHDGGAPRYCYGVLNQGQADEGAALVCFDLASGEVLKRPLGFAREIGPLTLVPQRSRAHEARSFLFAPVYDAVRDTSELSIFDTERLERPPVASIRLPIPLRAQLAGTWLCRRFP